MTGRPEGRWGRFLVRHLGPQTGRQLWDRPLLRRLPYRWFDVWWSGRCEQCGDPYRLRRGADADVRYCSDSCRSAARNIRRRARKAAAKKQSALHAIERILAAAPAPPPPVAEPVQVPPAPRPLAAPRPALRCEETPRPVMSLLPCPRPDKQVYVSAADAEDRRLSRWARDPQMLTYLCVCGFYHLGHDWIGNYHKEVV